MTKASTETRDVALFIFLGFLWGGSFVAIKEVVETIPPWFSASLRMLVASIALAILLRVRQASFSLPKGAFIKVWAAGIVTLGLPFGLLFWGEKSISAGLAGILNGTTPIWTSLMALFLLKHDQLHHLSWRSWVGLTLGFVGIFIIFKPFVEAKDLQASLAALAVLGMAVCYAIGNIVNRKLILRYKDLKSVPSVFHQHLASFLFLGLGSLLFESGQSVSAVLSSAKIYLSILYLGVFSTALALLIYFYLLRKIGSVKTSAVTYVVPVVAVFLDLLLRSSAPSASALLGVAFVFIGVFFVRTTKISPPASPGNEQA